MRIPHFSIRIALAGGFLLPFAVPAGAGILDVVPGAAAAYSLRQLHDAYAGYAIEVRSSGGGTANIGFDANGRLDTAALLSAVGAGNDGFVIRWYDQVGSAHVAQNTANLQPQIVASGALITNPINHLPALRFSSSMLNYGGNLSSETMSIFAAAAWVTPPTSSNLNAQRLWTLRSGGSSRAAAGGDWGTTGGYPSAVSQFSISWADPGHAWSRTGTQIFPDQPFVTSYLYDASLYDDAVPGSSDALYFYVDGELEYSQTSNLILNIGGVNHFSVGAHNDTERQFDGLMQEVVIYHSVLSGPGRARVEGNMMALYIPEPGSLLLLLAGGVAILLRRGR